MIFTLNGLHNDATATINVVESIASVPPATSGYIRIESEIISYTGKGTNSFTGCTRGVLSTSAAPHATNLLFGTFFDTSGQAIPQLQIDTTVKVIAKPSLDIPTTTVNINAMVTGSAWIVLDLDNNRTVRASGTATTANISTTFENFKPFNAMIYIRKLGYLPAEYPVYINSGSTTIYVSQKADPIA